EGAPRDAVEPDAQGEHEQPERASAAGSAKDQGFERRPQQDRIEHRMMGTDETQRLAGPGVQRRRRRTVRRLDADEERQQHRDVSDPPDHSSTTALDCANAVVEARAICTPATTASATQTSRSQANNAAGVTRLRRNAPRPDGSMMTSPRR